MKKCDFKKLIITGIASGALLATQAGNADNDQESKDEKGSFLLAAGGCGANSCANPSKPNNGNTPSKKSTTTPTETPVETPPTTQPETDTDVTDNSTTNPGKSACNGKNKCSGKTTPNSQRGSSCAARSNGR